MPFPLMDKTASAFPLARRLAEEAAREERTTLLRFFFFHEPLASLLQATARQGLDLIVLKGAALAETVYPRPGLRPFGDLDILVRPADAARARDLLESLGYVVDPQPWEDLIGGRDCQANFFKDTRPGLIVVELHTDLVNNDFWLGSVQVDMAGLWERAQAVRLAGVPARMLGPEDQLLHLCLHLAGHYLAAPLSLRDIAQVCERSAPDWPLFLTLARRAGAATACFAGLSAAAQLLGAAVPLPVLGALAPRLGRGLLERYSEARAQDIVQGSTEPLRFPLLWLMLGSPGARLKAIVRLFFPARRWLTAHYYYDLFDNPEGPRLAAGRALSPRQIGAKLYGAHLRFLWRSFGRVFRLPAGRRTTAA